MSDGKCGVTCARAVCSSKNRQERFQCTCIIHTPVAQQCCSRMSSYLLVALANGPDTLYMSPPFDRYARKLTSTTACPLCQRTMQPIFRPCLGEERLSVCGLLLCHGRVPSARRDHHTTGALDVAILTHRQSRAGEHLPTPNVQQLLSWVAP